MIHFKVEKCLWIFRNSDTLPFNFHVLLQNIGIAVAILYKGCFLVSSHYLLHSFKFLTIEMKNVTTSDNVEIKLM